MRSRKLFIRKFPHFQATGLHSLFHAGLTSCLNGFGRRFDKSCGNMAEIARTADGILKFVPTDPDDAEAVVRELSMLLTDGRLNDVARAVIEKAYLRVEDFLGRQHALRAALKLIVLTAEFHSTKCVWACCKGCVEDVWGSLVPVSPLK